MSPVRRVFSLLLGVTACGGSAPSAARGLAYPEARPPERAAQPMSAPPPAAASSPAARNPAPNAEPTGLESFGSAPFASEGPTLVEQASSDGRWVALCQARQDADAVSRYLIAPGEELSIDGWLGASRDGRFALFLRGGALQLWNSTTRQTVDLSALGADDRLSAESNAAVRTLDFDAQGEHLLYVKRGASGSRVVLRSLIDGSERELDPGPGEVWRARFDPGGAFVTLQMIATDTNKNGKLDFPAPLLGRPRSCGDDLNHFHSWEARGDRPETVLLPLGGGAPIREPELLMPVLDTLLLRDENGALWLARAGKKRRLVGADCKGRLIHADAERELFIVGCAQKKKTGRVSLELVTREGQKPLDIELASVELDAEVSDSPRLVALYPGSDSVLFDAERRQLIPLQAGDSVIATRGSRALIRRGKALALYDADSHQEQLLSAALDKYPEILRAPPFVFVSPVLVDLDRALIVGQSQKRPLALSASGQILVGQADPDAPQWARGKLRWLTLTPTTAD